MTSYDYEMNMPVDPHIIDNPHILDGMRDHAADHFAQHPAQQHLQQYAVHQQYHDEGLPQIYQSHDPSLDAAGYMNHSMHDVHAGVPPGQQHDRDHGHEYGDDGVVEDAQLQEQLRQDMGQQYRHAGS